MILDKFLLGLICTQKKDKVGSFVRTAGNDRVIKEIGFHVRLQLPFSLVLARELICLIYMLLDVGINLVGRSSNSVDFQEIIE